MVAHELREPEPTLSAHASPAKAKSAAAHPEVFEHTAPPFFPEHSRVPKWVQDLLTHLYIFAAVHYSFWGVPILALLYWIYQVRDSHGFFEMAPFLTIAIIVRAIARVWTLCSGGARAVRADVP